MSVCVLIFVFNALSMSQISMRNKKFKEMAGKSNNFVRSVIGMNVVFVAIYLPWGIIFLTHHTTNFANNDAASLDKDDFVNKFWYQMLYAVSDCISYFNNMSPFFLSLMYNTLFHREICRMIGCKRKPSQVSLEQSKSMSVRETMRVSVVALAVTRQLRETQVAAKLTLKEITHVEECT